LPQIKLPSRFYQLKRPLLFTPKIPLKNQRGSGWLCSIIFLSQVSLFSLIFSRAIVEAIVDAKENLGGDGDEDV